MRLDIALCAAASFSGVCRKSSAGRNRDHGSRDTGYRAATRFRRGHEECLSRCPPGTGRNLDEQTRAMLRLRQELRHGILRDVIDTGTGGACLRPPDEIRIAVQPRRADDMQLGKSLASPDATPPPRWSRTPIPR